jgi:hypothetical protein
MVCEVIINMFIKRRNTKLTHHTLHLIFETNALFMVSLVAKPVEFGLYRFCIYMLFYCRQNKITQHQKRVTIFALFSFSFVCLFCFSSVNIFKVKLVVSFCYLSLNYWDMEYCSHFGYF